jgi:fructose-1-phosphate kinase PfkB-like protein
MSQGVYAASPATITVSKTINSNDSVTAAIAYQNSTIVPDAAFSLGVGTGISAYHFLATATASSKRSTTVDTDRDSTAVHSQAFYVVGPGASTL